MWNSVCIGFPEGGLTDLLSSWTSTSLGPKVHRVASVACDVPMLVTER